MDRVPILGEFGIGVPILLSETLVEVVQPTKVFDERFRQEV
jgi:hypothetical protein